MQVESLQRHKGKKKYAYVMNHTHILPYTCMGQITCPIRIWDTHTRMELHMHIGAPYVYGQPIHMHTALAKVKLLTLLRASPGGF